MKEMLNNELAGIGERTGNLYDDYIVDERFRYYLILIICLDSLTDLVQLD